MSPDRSLLHHSAGAGEPDLWLWRAYYKDGTFLDELDADGTLHGFKDVDLEKCVALQWIPTVEGLPAPHVRINLDKGERGLLFRRRGRIFDPNIGRDIGAMPVYHCIGWEVPNEDPSLAPVHASYLFLFEDGSIMMTADKQAV